MDEKETKLKRRQEREREARQNESIVKKQDWRQGRNDVNKVVVDIGRKEFSDGLTSGACSRIRHLKDLLYDAPFSFERLKSIQTTSVYRKDLVKMQGWEV